MSDWCDSGGERLIISANLTRSDRTIRRELKTEPGATSDPGMDTASAIPGLERIG